MRRQWTTGVLRGRILLTLSKDEAFTDLIDLVFVYNQTVRRDE